MIDLYFIMVLLYPKLYKGEKEHITVPHSYIRAPGVSKSHRPEQVGGKLLGIFFSFLACFNVHIGSKGGSVVWYKIKI